MNQGVDESVLIVGLGLIGGSIALGLARSRPILRLLAVDTEPQALAQAERDGVVSGSGSLAEMAPLADLIVLAVPPRTVAGLLPELEACCRPDAVITDVTSVKRHIVDAVNMQSTSFQRRFVPGHPIAGSERSGFAAASDNLFHGRKVILTPQLCTETRAVSRVNHFWRNLGAEILGMSVDHHDEVLAATSHLPHLLAFAVVETLLERKQSEDIFRYAAGGFADFSRLASSDARMWSDIFKTNASANLEILDAYTAELQKLRELILAGDDQALELKFAKAKRTRDRFVSQNFSSTQGIESEPDRVSFITEPGGSVNGTIRVPGDKSISHRSVIMGALAEGVTEVNGFLEGEDALNTVAAFREMGVTIVGPEAGRMRIYGVGKNGLQAPRKALYMGNSGTAMRLLAGLLAPQSFASELTGDESLSRRPMGRVADPLRQMGARITTDSDGSPPVVIQSARLHGINYSMPMASAQVKSCLLLAGLFADGETVVTEPAPTRDHTERMLQGFGYPLLIDPDTASVHINSAGRLRATNIDVPADISSAAFFLVAASITPGAELRLQHVGINPTRIGVINILKAMGASIELSDSRLVGGEPVADLQVRYAPLRGVTIQPDQIPLAIDEFPVLFVAAACAEGETLLRGAEELRVKESDRIEAMAIGLSSLGVAVETFADGIRIAGGSLGSGEVNSHGDHRIAMAFAVAGLRASGPIRILDCANVATSFPGFLRLATETGMRVSSIDG